MSDKRVRDEQGRWPKGISGNPGGRPLGSRNQTTVLIQTVLAEKAEELVRKTVEKALEGDPAALKLCLERLFPPCKDHPIHLELPNIENAQEISEALRAVVAAIGEGEITPSEGQILAQVLTAQMEIVNTEDIDRRLKELEQRIRSEENHDLDKAA